MAKVRSEAAGPYSNNEWRSIAFESIEGASGRRLLRSKCAGARSQGDGGGFHAEDSRAQRDGLPAGGCGGGDFGVGEAAFGADGELGGDWLRKV